MTMPSSCRDVSSPCTGVCTLDAAGLCLGCHRSGDEIAAWRTLDTATRRQFMEQVLPARAALRGRADAG